MQFYIITAASEQVVLKETSAAVWAGVLLPFPPAFFYFVTVAVGSE